MFRLKRSSFMSATMITLFVISKASSMFLFRPSKKFEPDVLGLQNVPNKLAFGNYFNQESLVPINLKMYPTSIDQRIR